MHTVKRILRYNSKRRDSVIVNGHVHSLILAISMTLPYIISSIATHDMGWVIIGLLAVYMPVMWMFMEWGLYWTGHNDTDTNRRRSRSMLWFATGAAILLIIMCVLVKCT